MDDQTYANLSDDDKARWYLLYGMVLAASLLLIEALMIMGLVPPHELG